MCELSPIMNTNAQEIALAQLEGYRAECLSPSQLGHDASRYPYRLMGPTDVQQGTWWETEWGAWSHGPKYLDDLNAIHRVILKLKTMTVTEPGDTFGYPLYPLYLMYLMNVIHPMHGARPGDDVQLMDMVSATAAERAEAILKACGRWTA